jgi:hypothetical protein
MANAVVLRTGNTGRNYLSAAMFGLIGCLPFVFIALDRFEANEWPILAVGVGLIAFALLSGANSFLGYPLLKLDGSRLIYVRNPFTQDVTELELFGPAYVTQYYDRKQRRTLLVFRTVEAEAKHRAVEKFPYAPEWNEADTAVPIAALVGTDLAAGEALAAEINARRGLTGATPQPRSA